MTRRETRHHWLAFAIPWLLPLTVAAMQSQPEAGEATRGCRVLPGTLIFALLLSISHLASPWIASRLAAHRRLVSSFGGGMAIAYVFAHLMPELAEGDHLLGPRIFLIALAGFIIYYGLQRFAETQVDRARERGHDPPAFRLELGFLFVYNWLIVYGAPRDRMESGLGVVTIAIALWIHLVQSDGGLNREHEAPFRAWGRYVLALAPLLGWLSALFLRSNDEVINDVFVALLAGTVLYNAFQDELPKGEEANYRAFLAGVITFTAFVLFSRFI